MCDLLSVCKCKCPIICVPPYPADFLNRRRPCPQSFALALVLVSPLALVCVFALVLALPTFHPGVPASPTSRWGKQSRQLSSTFHSDFLHWDHCAQCTRTTALCSVHWHHANSRSSQMLTIYDNCAHNWLLEADWQLYWSKCPVFGISWFLYCSVCVFLSSFRFVDW